MTQEEMNYENALANEKYEVIKELMQYLHDAQFDRETMTSVMLKKLREKIDNMLLNDF
jgi:hypothetical protein